MKRALFSVACIHTAVIERSSYGPSASGWTSANPTPRPNHSEGAGGGYDFVHEDLRIAAIFVSGALGAGGGSESTWRLIRQACVDLLWGGRVASTADRAALEALVRWWLLPAALSRGVASDLLPGL